jgi:hypothetical protein
MNYNVLYRNLFNRCPRSGLAGTNAHTDERTDRPTPLIGLPFTQTALPINFRLATVRKTRFLFCASTVGSN